MVCTDHGFLLGERGWYGKNVQPWYQETIHTPLYVWDPRIGNAGSHCDKLVQTIDFGPTLLDVFDVAPTSDMTGASLGQALRGETLRDTALFGIFGGHVCITDGRYIYMRACATPENGPLEEYSLMPMRMDRMFGVGELRGAHTVEPLPFTKGVPVLKLPGWAMSNPHAFGTLLFDLQEDPHETTPLDDEDLELRMATLLTERLRLEHAPDSQFARLGLPRTGPVTTSHLLTKAQRAQTLRTLERDWRSAPAETFSAVMNTPMQTLRTEDSSTWKAIRDGFQVPLSDVFVTRFGAMTAWQMAVTQPAMTPQDLRQLDEALAAS